MTQETKQEIKTDIKRTKTSRELEAEIGETRSAITEDIRALSDKVSPANLKHEAKDAAKDMMNSAKDAAVNKATEVKDAAVNKASEVKDVVVDKAIEVKDATMDKAREVKDAAIDKATEVKDVAVEKAQQAAQAVSETYDEVSYQTRRVGRAAFRYSAANAIPLSMIGIGAGWLLANARRDRVRDVNWEGSTDSDTYRLPRTAAGSRDYPADNNEYYTSSAYSDYRQRDRGRDREPITSTLSNRSTALKQRAGQKLEDASRTLRDSAQRGKQVISERAVQLRDASRDLAQANPLALAVGTLIAGIGVGLLLPTSEREDRLLEPGRQRVRGLIGQAKETAREVGGIARQTAQDTTANVLR